MWIDDEFDKMSTFMKLCEIKHGINLTPFKTSKAGMEALEANIESWDAVILDAKVFNESEDEVAKLKGLRSSIDKINNLKHKREIPYFISTGQPNLLSDDTFRESFGHFYIKGTDDERLVADVIAAINKRLETQVKNKYSDVFSIEESINKELLSILIGLETDDCKNASYFNEIRKVLEWLRNEFISRSLIPLNTTDLNGFSRYICNGVAPVSIQRSIHSAIVVSQNGSHRLEIDEEVKNGNAPYLLKSTVYELLNILLWVKKVFSDNDIIADLKQRAAQDNIEDFNVEEKKTTDVNFTGIVCQDAKGNYFCGDYILPYKNGSEYLGHSITIISSRPNDNVQTNMLYGNFAIKWR